MEGEARANTKVAILGGDGLTMHVIHGWIGTPELPRGAALWTIQFHLLFAALHGQR